jgi:TolB protein
MATNAKRVILVLGAIALLAAAIRVVVPLFSHQNPDQIAFSYEGDIYLANADGRGLVNLTNHTGQHTFPAWSPDGEQIAYCSASPGQAEIFVMEADGSHPRRLTDSIQDCGNPGWLVPIWSPDGKWIAALSAPGGAYPQTPLDLFVIRSDGSETRNLTNSPAMEMGVSWSPDSQRLLFGSDREGDEEIYSIRVDGSGLTRLTDSPGRDGAAQWSPDGQQIVFISMRDGNWEVYRMGADGSGQTRLTENPGNDLETLWMPDGRLIAYIAVLDGNREIFVMHADGSGKTNLTNSPVNEAQVFWSPDGEHAAFTGWEGTAGDPEAKWDSWVMAANGSDRQLFEPFGTVVGYMSWRP